MCLDLITLSNSVLQRPADDTVSGSRRKKLQPQQADTLGDTDLNDQEAEGGSATNGAPGGCVPRPIAMEAGAWVNTAFLSRLSRLAPRDGGLDTDGAPLCRSVLPRSA